MALDIVYGYQGKDHVKASQLGRLLAGTFGGGRYVLDTQDGLAAEMQTANTVRIGTGDLVMDNRYMTNEAYVDLTVDSGQSGYNRNDLVCAKYERAAGDDPDHSVEDVDFVVLKGTPTTGEATDPSYTAGDISAQDATAIYPLWRLPIEGLTVGEPVQLFEKLQTYSSFRDSVSRKLWSGELSNGQSVNVSNVGDYIIYAVSTEGPSLIGVRTGDYIDCFGGTTSHTGVALRVSGESVEMTSSGSFGAITGLWGIA